MDDHGQGSSTREPHGAPPDPARLRAFWEVYDPIHDEIGRELEARLIDAGGEGSVIQRVSEAQRAAQRQSAHQLLRRAVAEGTWQPYAALLESQGRAYAAMGMSFPAWMAATRLFHILILERLAAAYQQRPEALADAFSGLQEFTDYALGVLGGTYLEAKEALIRQQNQAITELATPVLPIAEGLLVLPIIGVIDSGRAAQLTEQLLNAIRSHRARVAVVDITGVPAVDSAVANHLLQTVQAVRLMGARAIVSGLSAVNAQILVRIGVDLSILHTVNDLQAAVEEANATLGRRVVTVDPTESPQ